MDYRHYALDSWIGAIGLPDDCFKCVVDADGRFQTECGKSKGHQGFYPDAPAQNKVVIQADVVGGATRTGQRMHSARAPVSLTHKRSGDVTITEQLFLARPLDWSARVTGAALRDHPSRPDARQYLLMVEYLNQGSRPAEVTPLLRITGAAAAARLEESRMAFAVAANTRCLSSRDLEAFEPGKPGEASVTLGKITLGPGGYNDYWILDGSFVTEALDMLGRAEDAGAYADYLLLHQQPDGRILTIPEHWKETGIALVTLYRHARLIQDKDWLRQRWPQFSKAVESIKKLRRTGSSADPQALNYQLSLPGFGDGGIGHEAEFTNNHWLLAGLKAVMEAARWIGRRDDASAWETEYEDHHRAFRKPSNATPRPTRMGAATSQASWDRRRRRIPRAGNGPSARACIRGGFSPKTIP